MLLYRQADLDDIEQLIPLSIALIKESLYKDLPIVEEAIYDTLYRYVMSPNAIFLVACLEERIIGYIVGTTSIIPFNNLRQASETLWYVLPEFRQTNTGLCLYTGFEQWAIDQDTKVIHTASPNGSNLGKAYEKQGYTMFEEFYIKVLD